MSKKQDAEVKKDCGKEVMLGLEETVRAFRNDIETQGDIDFESCEGQAIMQEIEYLRKAMKSLKEEEKKCTEQCDDKNAKDV